MWNHRKSRAAVGFRIGVRMAVLAALLGPVVAAKTAAVPAGGPVWELPENPLEGRELFTGKKCVRCHAVWGEGGDYGPDLSQIGRNRTLLQLGGLLWNHSPRMNGQMAEQGLERPSFKPEEMQSLLSYLFFLNYFDEPGDFFAGERIFNEKKCVRCHAVGGKGGGLAGPLDHFRRDRTPIYFAQTMWNAGFEMTRMMEEEKIPPPMFKGDEYSHLLAYIRGEAAGEPGEPNYLQPGNPKKGKETFERKRCGSCHAIGRSEKPGIGPNLSERHLWKSVSEYAAVMWNHSSKMWAQMARSNDSPPTFEGNELADLIAYLYYNYYVDEPGNLDEGRKLFEDKNCARCHQVAGIGTIAGPDLTASKSALSPVALAASMWNHAPMMARDLEGESFSWPKFSGNEMRDLIAFIQAYAGTAQKTRPKKDDAGPVKEK